ncbi:PREDICTED: probable mitochondrial adenine nucleotide transporter BTL3 [Nelumbo nucifera]|uniref:Probable mitochondrial adenine nucleotide transporter BTL3 n=1 Tax=Nelumbo nucifera TaxID=4432 RepID=A0A1U8B0D2_NELNU|nr:PREDICTED: probable mitochondrial adenine nucleotide transporter BTL3 [Nelumbo nucifera]
MLGLELWFRDSVASQLPEVPALKDSNSIFFVGGGLFLESTVPASFVSLISSKNSLFALSSSTSSSCSSLVCCRKPVVFRLFRPEKREYGVVSNGFLSVSLSIKGTDGYVQETNVFLAQNGEKISEEAVAFEESKEEKGMLQGAGAMNTTKHLWAGAVAAMVSRTFVAPLERLKLEYIVRGEQRNLFELIKIIAASQGLKGFWKGNFVNILRTAPFKAVNFYAYDTYRKQLLKMSGNEETTNFERFLAGAAAGITATLLCLPLDTIRTKMVAPGGEALGGVIGAFRHMIQTEGFFSLYKGLVPSIASMAPSGAVFYGVYDILKSAYLHSPEGRKRIQHMNQQGQELNALDQLELGPVRTLLYGAVAGACAEAATYPFEVVRRQLQMQVQATKLSALATCVKIVEQGGVPALYAGLIPSLLQVLPSAAISYFVYEFMKIVLKVE